MNSLFSYGEAIERMKFLPGGFDWDFMNCLKLIIEICCIFG